MSNLIAVAVEHECFLLAGEYAATDTAFACLAPARVIHARVHIGIEAVLIRGGHVPASLRTR